MQIVEIYLQNDILLTSEGIWKRIKKKQDETLEKYEKPKRPQKIHTHTHKKIDPYTPTHT